MSVHRPKMLAVQRKRHLLHAGIGVCAYHIREQALQFLRDEAELHVPSAPRRSAAFENPERTFRPTRWFRDGAQVSFQVAAAQTLKQKNKQDSSRKERNTR